MEITENSESSPLDAPVEKEEETCPETAVTDPFEYLDRGEFTSEKFKIEISNLPRQCRKYCYAVSILHRGILVKYDSGVNNGYVYMYSVNECKINMWQLLKN